jgi:hypothetical protein
MCLWNHCPQCVLPLPDPRPYPCCPSRHWMPPCMPQSRHHQSSNLLGCTLNSRRTEVSWLYSQLGAGSSGHSVSFLTMRSSTLIIVVCASVPVSICNLKAIEDKANNHLHLGRPLILPIYLSSPAFNFIAMSSYDHFCFLQHLPCQDLPPFVHRRCYR